MFIEKLLFVMKYFVTMVVLSALTYCFMSVVETYANETISLVVGTVFVTIIGYTMGNKCADEWYARF